MLVKDPIAPPRLAYLQPRKLIILLHLEVLIPQLRRRDHMVLQGCGLLQQGIGITPMDRHLLNLYQLGTIGLLPLNQRELLVITLFGLVRTIIRQVVAMVKYIIIRLLIVLLLDILLPLNRVIIVIQISTDLVHLQSLH